MDEKEDRRESGMPTEKHFDRSEVDYLRATGELITEKQYKKYWGIYIGVSVTFGVFLLACLIGCMISVKEIFAYACLFSIFGGLIAYGVFCICFLSEYAGKIRLYWHYKKHPEDFEPKITQD
ncbi:MAG: hypothetical protein K2M95_07935 [Clostridiales bacterium]|nr:hypothetical protein [Clostridiales bacterium]